MYPQPTVRKLADIHGIATLYLPTTTNARLSFMCYTVGVDMFTFLTAFGEYILKESLQHSMLALGKGLNVGVKQTNVKLVQVKSPENIIEAIYASSPDLAKYSTSQILTMLTEFFLHNRPLCEAAILQHLAGTLKEVMNNEYFLAVKDPFNPPKNWVPFKQNRGIQNKGS